MCSVEHTDIPKVFFKLQHLGHCCTDVITGHCYVKIFSNNDIRSLLHAVIRGHFCTSMIWLHCWAVTCSNSDLGSHCSQKCASTTTGLCSHCCAIMCCKNGTSSPTVVQRRPPVMRTAYRQGNCDSRQTAMTGPVRCTLFAPECEEQAPRNCWGSTDWHEVDTQCQFDSRVTSSLYRGVRSRSAECRGRNLELTNCKTAIISFLHWL
jgi:hypothetical protein